MVYELITWLFEKREIVLGKWYQNCFRRRTSIYLHLKAKHVVPVFIEFAESALKYVTFTHNKIGE